MLPYPYQVFSMGIEFLTFAIGDSCIGENTPPKPPLEGPAFAPGDAPAITPQSQVQNIAERQLFAGLMDHCACKYKVNQDIKLTNVVTHQPAGFGTSGNVRQQGLGIGSLGALSNFSNGRCHIDNRYKFSVPIDMPRGVNFNVTLFFSQYAKYVLSMLRGPQTWYQQSLGIETEGGIQPAFKSVAGIAVTMIGYREVQQRGDLHA